MSIDPVKANRRRQYVRRKRDELAGSGQGTGDLIMGMLIDGMNDRSRARACAQRLLSDYSIYELGEAMYHRAYRVLHPRHDPILAKVRPKGKPGALSAQEREEYQTRAAVADMIRILENDSL